jgi:hypothetical protein
MVNQDCLYEGVVVQAVTGKCTNIVDCAHFSLSDRDTAVAKIIAKDKLRRLGLESSSEDEFYVKPSKNVK